MSRFDTGAVPSWSEVVGERILSILGFPLLTLFQRMELRFPGLWGYVPFVANSALWAAAGLALFRLANSLRTSSRTRA